MLPVQGKKHKVADIRTVVLDDLINLINKAFSEYAIYILL